MEKDAKTRQLEANAKNQIFYLEAVSQALSTNCTEKAVLGHTIMQTNLGAENWILGNKTINDIIQESLKKLEKYENISNCPI